MTGRETTTTKQYSRERRQGFVVRREVHAKQRQKERDEAKSERKVRISCTDSKSLQYVQCAYALHQLVQYRRRDLFYLDSDQTLCSNPPECCYVAEVRCEQQRTKWLSQSSDHLERSHLPFCRRQRRRGSERCCVSRKCGTGPSTNRSLKASRGPRCAFLRGCRCDAGRARKQWKLVNRRRPIVCALFGYRFCYTSNGLSVKEKVNPRMNKVQETDSREIFLGPDLHNPDSCLCPENISRPASRSRWRPKFEIEAWKFHPLSYERRHRELM